MQREQLPEWAQFQAKITTHPIIQDKDGVFRYQSNRLVRWLFGTGNLDLNAMRVAYFHSAFSKEEYMQFYRDLGYSLSGFDEVFSEELSEMEEQGAWHGRNTSKTFATGCSE